MMDWIPNTGISAFLAAIFAGIAACCAIITLIDNHRLRQKAKIPDLYLAKDKFVYGEYEFFDLKNGVPKDIPEMTASFSRRIIVRDGLKLNQFSIIYNASRKHTNNDIPENYTHIFGEVHLENRGGVTIKSIKLENCNFIMRKDTGLRLEHEFSLETEGNESINLQKGQSLIIYIAYLFDNDDHRLCDPSCLDENGRLNSDAMNYKRNEENQLRCPLPVIIDLYDELHFTLQYTTFPDNKEYQQHFIIKIQTEMEKGNKYTAGIYNPIDCATKKVRKAFSLTE